MRRTGGSSGPNWVIDENETCIGIQLGADFCAEHEFGIKKLNHRLGVMGNEEGQKNKVFGSERYTVSTAENFIYVREEGDSLLLLVIDPWRGFEELDDTDFEKLVRNYELTIYEPFRDEKPKTLATAWDESSFGIHAKGDDKAHLKELIEALRNNNVVIYLGAPPLPAFSNSSLNIIIADRIPQEGEQAMVDAHQEKWQLDKDVEKVGILKRLKEAECRFMACRPHRGKPHDKESKHDLKFWLNPWDQQNNNYGWYTVEELDAWIKGEGPIPKQSETV